MFPYRLFLLIFLIPAAAAAQPERELEAEPIDWSNAETVTITLSSFEFTPETIALEHGRPFRLVLDNISSGGHNFVAREFFEAAQMPDEDRARLDRGRIELDSGRRISVRVYVAEPGRYCQG